MKVRAKRTTLTAGVLVVIIFKRDVAQGVILAAFMFLLYIPLGFATDTFVYRFRQRRKQAR